MDNITIWYLKNTCNAKYNSKIAINGNVLVVSGNSLALPCKFKKEIPGIFTYEYNITNRTIVISANYQKTILRKQYIDVYIFLYNIVKMQIQHCVKDTLDNAIIEPSEFEKKLFEYLPKKNKNKKCTTLNEYNKNIKEYSILRAFATDNTDTIINKFIVDYILKFNLKLMHEKYENKKYKMHIKYDSICTCCEDASPVLFCYTCCSSEFLCKFCFNTLRDKRCIQCCVPHNDLHTVVFIYDEDFCLPFSINSRRVKMGSMGAVPAPITPQRG
jgi:hypothetical protein